MPKSVFAIITLTKWDRERESQRAKAAKQMEVFMILNDGHNPTQQQALADEQKRCAVRMQSDMLWCQFDGNIVSYTAELMALCILIFLFFFSVSLSVCASFSLSVPYSSIQTLSDERSFWHFQSFSRLRVFILWAYKITW